MMLTMIKNQMMDKVEELQEVLGYLTWVDGVELFNISSMDDRHKDITVCGLNLEYEEFGDITIMTFVDVENRLPDAHHQLMMLMLNQVSDITITDDYITITIGAATYTITPVRG